MRTLTATAAPLIFAALTTPALAQSAADRIDPAHTEERTRDKGSAATIMPAVTAVSEANAGELSGAAFEVGAIDITGLQVLPRARFADIVEQYIGRTLSAAELSQLADQLAARARLVYPLASATIAPQALRAGVLQVTIDEGRIDEVRLDGAQNRAVLAALRRLATGKPVTASQLERSLLIAGDVDGVILGKARIAQEGAHNVLVVKVAYRKIEGNLTLDNDSTKPVGPLELYGSIHFNRVLGDDDSLQLNALGSLPHPGELSYGRARYSKRVTAAGTELALTGSYSRNAPGAYLNAYDFRGESWLGSVSLLHPLLRGLQTSVWVDASLSHRELRRDEAATRVLLDRLTIARAGLHGATRVAGGHFSANVSFAQGLDLFGATRSGDPLASRSDADATFSALSMSADWSRKIVGGFGLNLAARSQLSSQPLLLSEEIGLGGATFGRGYDYSERTGDQGVMGYGEVNYHWNRPIGPLSGLSVYVFADGGNVSNLAGGFGGGSLFSSGSGLRATVSRRTNAALEIAVPLSGARYDSSDESPRFRFTLARDF